MALNHSRTEPSSHPSEAWGDQELLWRILSPRGSGPTRKLVERCLSQHSLGDLVFRRNELLPHWRLSLGQQHRARTTLELAYRVSLEHAPSGVVIHGPARIAELSTDLLLQVREHFVVFYLNVRNVVVSRETISIGSLTAAIVHPREVFEPALRHRAAGIIVVHNHPSGNPGPSDDDVRITRRLQEAGNVLGIPLLDHVIVARDGFVSMQDDGYMK
jgi:DNA repair protein RadC